MTISPIGFVTAAPIAAIQRVDRVKRRPKSSTKDEEQSAGSESSSQPMYAATTPEEIASDETRNALLNIRLGG